LLIHVWTGKNSYNFPIRSKLFRNPINWLNSCLSRCVIDFECWTVVNL
jgi:hypothetical protein